MNKYYPLQHWLATLIIAPLLMIVYKLTRVGSTLRVEFYAFVLLYSFLFSIPGFLLYTGLFHLIGKSKKPAYLIKIILNSCAICIGLATLLFIEKSLINLFIIYTIAVIISSFLFKIYKTEKPLPIEEDEHTQS
jgi:hypothetical protein